MHNCLETKEKMLDFVFGELAPGERAEFERETKICAACRAERLAVEQTLQIFDLSTQTFEPTENEWRVYQTELLANFAPAAKSSRASSNVFTRIFFSSVRVPSPIFAAALLLCGAAVFFAARSFNAKIERAPVSIAANEIAETNQAASEKLFEKPIEKTIEKIVVRDRIVLQKVFVRQKTQNSNRKSAAQTIANSNKKADQLNLAEFKPIAKTGASVIKVENVKVELENEK